MTRREVLVAGLMATPALAGTRADPNGAVDLPIRVLILTVDPALLGTDVEIDRGSIDAAVHEAFTKAGLPVPEVLILTGLRVEVQT